MIHGWSCPDCGADDPELHYSSGKMKRCKDCQRFYNISVNAKQKRKRLRTPEIRIGKPEFLAWLRGTKRICAYCGITEPDLERVGLRTQIDLPIQALGVDRLDANRDYEPGNIQLCCFACNKARGNVFSSEEMYVLGQAIAEIWKIRLAKA